MAGNSAKVFVLSFCSPLCKFVHGTRSQNPALYFSIIRNYPIAMSRFNPSTVRIEPKVAMKVRFNIKTAVHFLVTLKFAEFPDHISIDYDST